jgi:hypothetical protein
MGDPRIESSLDQWSHIWDIGKHQPKIVRWYVSKEKDRHLLQLQKEKSIH